MPKLFASVALLCGSLSFQQAVEPIPHQLTDEVMAADAKAYPEFSAGYSVDENIASGKNIDPDAGGYVFHDHLHEEKSPGHSPLYGAEIDELTYNSDGVVLATILSVRAGLTANHKFIFSDYQARIDAVYSDKNRKFDVGGAYIITRAGGSVNYRGINVFATEDNFPLFRINSQYLLFLHARPSGSYYVSPSGAFILKDGNFIAVRNNPKPELQSINSNQLIQKIQVAAQLMQRDR